MESSGHHQHTPRSGADSGTEAPAPSARRDRQADELDALRRALDGAVAESEAATRLLRARQRELEQTRSALTAGLRTLRRQLELVQGSRAWRYGHGVSQKLRRVGGRRIVTEGGVVAAIGQVDRLLGLLGAPPQPVIPPEPESTRRAPQPAASRGDELLLGIRARDRLGQMPSGTVWPPVSIVVTSRSAELTQSALDHVVDTAYPDLQVIVVDNASPGGEVAGCAGRHPAPGIEVEQIETATSYANANNRGAERATGEQLLFLNDDVRPVEPGWLRELVRSSGPRRTDVVGATLVDPRRTPEPLPGGGRYRLEQRGITLELRGGAFSPVRRDEGADLFDGAFGTDRPAVAVSGASMLISRRTFAALGGFDEGYQYGLEDIDLCLRARDRGHAVVSSGRAVLVHEGAASQRLAGREFRRINRELNRRRLHRMWGPRLRRERLEGLLRGDPVWGDGPHLAIVRTSNDPGAGWGDFHTAAELGEAAAGLGWRVTYIGQRDQPAEPPPDDIDIAVVLLDRFDPRGLPPSVITCAWVRNWTDRWLSRPWLTSYDILLASSSRSLEMLRAGTGREVHLFPLASNPRRFRPAEPGAEPQLDWVFTGNRWGEERAIETAVGSQRRDRAAIYGRGWEGVKRLRRLVRGTVGYEDLPAIYAGAKVVLDDTAEPALRYDAVNARVFDALAAGTPVLTNCAAGVRELFDDEFPTWSSADELHDRLQPLLTQPEHRAGLAARYRQMVLAEHTYQHRVRRLRGLAREHNERLSFCLKIGAPDWEQAERWGDLHLARGLGGALRRLGHRWRVEVVPEWDSPEGSTFDVTIHVRGRSQYTPAPAQLNVLWLISHPDSFDPAEAEAYDLACVASERFAASLRERASVPVRVLEQATDPTVFFPDPDPALAHELVFVGNTRGVSRPILEDLLPTDRDLAIWGGGWEGTPAAAHLVAEHIPNAELRKVYSSAQIVLCDHWPDMRAAGFRSNRLYDALACGALVISDDVAGLDGSLGDAVLTYAQAGDLDPLIGRLLADPEERCRRVSEARARILASETFDDRARQLVSWVEEIG